MAKQKLTPDQYMAELNRRLRADESFEAGMEFVPHPPGSSGRGMLGYSMTVLLDKPFWPSIYAKVANKVGEDFDHA